jgi:D-Tyr-tRNAtyr deacylase
MSGEAAKSFYEDFLAELRKQHSPDKIKDGVFGEYMQVLLTMHFRGKTF